MGITSGIYRKYTVIVEGMGRDDMPGYHYVEAMTKEGAIALAKKLQYNDEHIGWDAKSLETEPYDESDYYVPFVFDGHPNLV